MAKSRREQKEQQQQQHGAAISDERFDLSSWEPASHTEKKRKLEDTDDDVLGNKTDNSSSGSDADDNDNDNDMHNHEAHESYESHGTESVLPVLSREELEEYKKKQQKRGVIYLSRLPPGMTPAKVRHIFSQFGEVGRIYLQPKDKQNSSSSSSKKKNRPSHFSEGWIEFVSKRVARTTAEMLNAQPIGALGGASHSSRRSQSGAGAINRWKDDVWTMKYLKGFRWPMLMEQLSHERATHAARLRMELSQSAHEQRDYLRKVERSRIQRKKQAERAEPPTNEDEAPAPKRKFQQRTPVYRDVRDQRVQNHSRTSAPAGQDMERVLSQIF